MTRLAGPIRQLGIIVPDADEAIKYWADVVGVGPFVVFREMTFDNYRYRGEPVDSPVTTIGLAFSGSLQIEIIQQHNDAPSAYRDFSRNGRGEFQHVSPWFADEAGYDAAYKRLQESGLEIVHEGSIPGTTTRFAYFSAPGGGWPQLEISEAMKPGPAEMWAALQAAAQSWDGTSPVREGADWLFNS